MGMLRALSLLVATQLLLSAAPALADDGASQPSESKWSKILAVPKTAAGVVYGVTLGVPIRSVKYIYSEDRRMTRTLLDDFGGMGGANVLMAQAISIPYSLASGSILGLIRGVQYGGEYGAEEPFSKKSIGVGEPCVVGQR